MVRTKMRKMCTYHEYRLSYGLAALTGIMTGIADATIDDWSVKAFTWTAILFLYTLIASYEFIVMPTPPKPLLQAFLFILLAPMGLLPAHHYTWYLLSIMLGRSIEFRLWLAPNIYMDLNIYNTIMLISLFIYMAYLIITNFVSCEKEY
jgi:hypothetical protein